MAEKTTSMEERGNKEEKKEGEGEGKDREKEREIEERSGVGEDGGEKEVKEVGAAAEKK